MYVIAPKVVKDSQGTLAVPHEDVNAPKVIRGDQRTLEVQCVDLQDDLPCIDKIIP